ncbi:hypothetical protein L596_008085 [Steinernema carpocapsae]|uniref:Uncharacterized protein n=1 Tax=Steinernema carpocapsae TaxID=34508 RepID=A0A4U5PBG9_STECR|nr:hypothetical protein L596_008085 [Steinernema carpocapsae]
MHDDGGHNSSLIDRTSNPPPRGDSALADCGCKQKRRIIVSCMGAGRGASPRATTFRPYMALHGRDSCNVRLTVAAAYRPAVTQNRSLPKIPRGRNTRGPPKRRSPLCMWNPACRPPAIAIPERRRNDNEDDVGGTTALEDFRVSSGVLHGNWFKRLKCSRPWKRRLLKRSPKRRSTRSSGWRLPATVPSSRSTSSSSNRVSRN